MTVVRFLKVWRMYQPGETAGFDADVAAALIGQGFAVSLQDALAVSEAEDEAAAAEAAATAAEEAAAKGKKG